MKKNNNLVKIMLVISGIGFIVTAIGVISISTQNEPKVITETVVIHDTIPVQKPHIRNAVFDAALDSTVKTLLIQYYKAGWMDGSDGVIGLHNADKFTDNQVLRLRNKDWRKMELQVNSK
jgi:hypothetical protein